MEQDTAMMDGIISTPQPGTGTPAHISSASNMPATNVSNGAATNGEAAMPKQAAHHGAPVRDYLNTKVTGVLLEGMRLLALEKPDQPLRALGEFLLKRSAEIEGPSGDSANGQQ